MADLCNSLILCSFRDVGLDSFFFVRNGRIGIYHLSFVCFGRIFTGRNISLKLGEGGILLGTGCVNCFIFYLSLVQRTMILRNLSILMRQAMMLVVVFMLVLFRLADLS